MEMACGAALAAVYSGIIRKLQDESKHAMKSPPWVDSHSALKPFRGHARIPIVVVLPPFRPSAGSLAPPVGDRVRWQQHQHGAIGQP